MGEDREPAFGDGIAIVAIALVDAVDGGEVVSHYPGRVQVGRGRNEVANIGGLFVLAFDDDSLMERGVARK